jgi:predicted DNA-binding transcriptional regulator YafY
MRADRLISIIMLLQIHARMTAEELSLELEVSPRTIYRDISALNQAGIPIYTDRGPGGGIALIESYRTSLTGMNEDETRALFMLNIPQALVDLGVGQKLKSALLKLAVALPPGQQRVQAHTQQRIYLDSTSWDEPVKPLPHLGILHQAVWQDKRVRLDFRGSFDTELEFVVEPLGLVAKMNTWYLIGKDKNHVRVFNVSDITGVEILAESFTRESSFDLSGFWKDWCSSFEMRRSYYTARLAVTPSLLKKLGLYLGETVKFNIGDRFICGDKEWYDVTIRYEHFFRARESVLNFGRAAMVLEPDALKVSVQDFAQQIVELYNSI